jgi:hypothetical protein
MSIKGGKMKLNLFIIMAALFTTNTIFCAADPEKTGEVVLILVAQVVDSAHGIVESKEVLDKKERRKQRLAHVARIIKAVTVAILEIIAASKNGHIHLTRAGTYDLQKDVEAKLKSILADMLFELNELEDQDPQASQEQQNKN